MDLSANIFPNQFNIELNRGAAKFVFENYKKFLSFTVVPSHSAQHQKYSFATSQINGVELLKKRILGFNCQEDPHKIAANEVVLSHESPQTEFSMPDLTSIRCALKPEDMERHICYVRVKYKEGVLLFEKVRKAREGIRMCDLTTLEFEKALP